MVSTDPEIVELTSKINTVVTERILECKVSRFFMNPRFMLCAVFLWYLNELRQLKELLVRRFKTRLEFKPALPSFRQASMAGRPL